jgi:hypothetical protein
VRPAELSGVKGGTLIPRTATAYEKSGLLVVLQTFFSFSLASADNRIAIESRVDERSLEIETIVNLELF